MKKYTRNSAAWKRQQDTKNDQRIATKKFHPRGLARAVAKGLNKQSGKTTNDMSTWKEDVAKVPRTGNKFLRRKNGVKS